MSDSPPERPAVSRKKQSLINLISTYVSVAITISQGIILTPLYLKYITPSLYGAWLATGNILGWIGLIDPGISRILQQRTAYTFGRQEMERLGGVIGTGLMLGTGFAVLPLLLMPFSHSITGVLSLSAAEHAELSVAFKWGLAALSLMIAAYQPAAANLGLQRSLSAGVSYAVASVAGIVVTLCMLQWGFGLLSIPVGLFVRAVVLLLFNASWMLHWCSQNLRGLLAIRKDELRSYTALSALTFVERLASVVVTQSDIFLVATFFSNGTAVFYSLTGRAFEPVRMTAERLLPAFLPGIAHLSGEGGRERLREIARRLMGIIAIIASVGAACVIAMNFVFVKLWIGENYFGGEWLTLSFASLMVAQLLFTCLAEITFAVGGVGPIERLRVVETGVRLVLQLVFLKLLGVAGIPLGGCLGIMLTSGYVLPGLAARTVGENPGPQYRAVAINFLRAIVLMTCGVITWYFLSRQNITWTWIRFVAYSAIIGTLFSAFGLAMSPSTLQELRLLRQGISSLRTQVKAQKP